MKLRNHLKKAVTFFMAVTIACAIEVPAMQQSVYAEANQQALFGGSSSGSMDVSVDGMSSESLFFSGSSYADSEISLSGADHSSSSKQEASTGSSGKSSGDLLVGGVPEGSTVSNWSSSEEAVAEADIAKTQKADRKAVSEGVKVDPAAGNVYVDVLTNEKEIFSFLRKELGLNHAAAAGVLGNIYYESGFNNAAIGDYGTSYGICQWHLGRYENLKNFCKASDLDYTSCIGQLHYLKYELENSYPTVLAHLRQVPDTADGAYDAAAFWCIYFEVPANREQKAVVRGNTTRTTYWPRYANVEAEDELTGCAETKVDVEKDPEIDYVKWMKEFAEDDSHGYSELLRNGETDVDAFSFVYYALQKNHYLEGENENIPFTVRDFSGYLNKHGFMLKSFDKIDEAELTEGDIIVTKDMKTIGVYDGCGKMFLAQRPEDEARIEQTGDQDGKEVTSVDIPKDTAVMIFHLMVKDELLPDYAQWMVDYADSNVHGFIKDGDDRVHSLDVDAESFLYRALCHNDYIEKGKVFDDQIEEKVLRKAGFEDVTGYVTGEDETCRAGDIVMNSEIGTAVYIGHNTYVLADRSTSEAARKISGDQSGKEVRKLMLLNPNWERVFRYKDLRKNDEESAEKLAEAGSEGTDRASSKDRRKTGSAELKWTTGSPEGEKNSGTTQNSAQSGDEKTTVKKVEDRLNEGEDVSVDE